jgi:hypothetical protein
MIVGDLQTKTRGWTNKSITDDPYARPNQVLAAMKQDAKLAVETIMCKINGLHAKAPHIFNQSILKGLQTVLAGSLVPQFGVLTL